MSLKKILIVIILALSIGLLFFTILFKNEGAKEGICKKIEVKIEKKRSANLVTEENILSLIKASAFDPVGKPIKEAEIDHIRKLIEKIPYVRYVSCYTTKYNQVTVEVQEREPVFRVVNAENLFVDTERVVVKMHTTLPAYLPVVSGYLTNTFAKNEMFDFVSYISNDKFLSNLIQQIYVNQHQEIELSLIVGNQVVRVGKINKINDRYDFEQKLNRLKAFYQSEALDRLGWDNYSSIDLRFDRQIVCKKR